MCTAVCNYLQLIKPRTAGCVTTDLLAHLQAVPEHEQRDQGQVAAWTAQDTVAEMPAQQQIELSQAAEKRAQQQDELSRAAETLLKGVEIKVWTLPVIPCCECLRM